MNDDGTFTGYASVFGEADSFGETIRPGAFRRAIETRSSGPPMLWSHDPSQPIGTWTDMAEDTRGLKVTGRFITETARGAEADAPYESRPGSAKETRRQVGDEFVADRFTADTARATGQSERKVQRDAERGTKVCDEAISVIQGDAPRYGCIPR